MRRLALVTLLLAVGIGCAEDEWRGSPVERPGQADAVRISWGEVYGQEIEQAPPILWRTDLDCENGSGFVSRGGVCVAGEAFDDHVEIADYDRLPSGTAMAHELCHAFMVATTGSQDANHLGRCFKGERLAEVAQQRLFDAGL